MKFLPDHVYCFLPSLHAEEGSFRIYNHMPEVIKDFLFCIQVSHFKFFAGHCENKEASSKLSENKNDDKVSKKLII